MTIAFIVDGNYFPEDLTECDDKDGKWKVLNRRDNPSTDRYDPIIFVDAQYPVNDSKDIIRLTSGGITMDVNTADGSPQWKYVFQTFALFHRLGDTVLPVS